MRKRGEGPKVVLYFVRTFVSTLAVNKKILFKFY